MRAGPMIRTGIRISPITRVAWFSLSHGRCRHQAFCLGIRNIPATSARRSMLICPLQADDGLQRRDCHLHAAVLHLHYETLQVCHVE